MTIDDVVLALEWMNIIKKTDNTTYVLNVDHEVLKTYFEKHNKIQRLRAQKKYLKWIPNVEFKLNA
jgi:hypothetical protein